MHHPAEIFAALHAFVDGELETAAKPALLTPETPLFKGGLELDSFAIVEVITHLESTFGFACREADFREEHFRSLGTLAALVERYVG